MKLFRKTIGVRSSTDEITMTQHLAELRFRIIRSLLAVIIGALLILSFYDPVLRFLTQPYRDLCLAPRCRPIVSRITIHWPYSESYYNSLAL